MNKRISLVTAFSFASAIALSACGGGGGGGDSSTQSNTGGNSTPPQTATSANVSTPQYAADSVELGIFNTINQQRQACGFPALTENTTLDKASAKHASYILQNNGAITDTEVAGNPGFTGVSYSDRASALGFPVSSASVGGESAGFYTNAQWTGTQYGSQLALSWMSGVYHSSIATMPVTEIGVGVSQITYNGFPQLAAANSVANYQPMSGSLPLTFPCQGTTGVAYSATGEIPTPPNTSGSFGTPISVSGNATDTVVLSTATMLDPAGNSIPLNILNSSTDPNHEVSIYEAKAYPSLPLTANTTYTVSLTGTRNGTPFSRNYTFTTGNIVG